MKSFKRIIDRSGKTRYYIDGKQVTTKRGASEYIKENFDKVKPENLTKQEKITYLNKQRAIKAASTLKKLSATKMRFKGRFLNKGLQNFLEKMEFLPTGQYNINTEYQDIRNYGDLLQEIKRMYPVNLKDTIFLDETAWTTPSQGRNRTKFENVSDIVESMKMKFPNWSLLVKVPKYTYEDENGKTIRVKAETITDFIKAVDAVRKWENRTSKELSNEYEKKGEHLAFIQYSHNADLNIDTSTVTIDLSKTIVDMKFGTP